jgi:hypothetical protein
MRLDIAATSRLPPAPARLLERKILANQDR